MGSLVKTYNKTKLEGKVYTPRHIVKKILDESGYSGKKILGRTILDPACGDGKFLAEIVTRIIKVSPKRDLGSHLLHVHGWDMDEESVKLCRRKLDELLPEGVSVDWNIIVFNPILNINETDIELFDFIVGNPPYIRIQHLSQDLRKFIQKQFRFCKKGATDIYVAFFELVFTYLHNSGTCGFITPNTFFYTETARELRNFLTENSYIKKLINYKDVQLFEDATTYSAITILKKTTNRDIKYEEHTKNGEKKRIIAYSEVRGSAFWQLSPEPLKKKKGVKLGELCHIHVGITTLCDKAYIGSVISRDGNLVTLSTRLKGSVKLEKDIVKPVIKGSTQKDSHDVNNEMILFPYKKVNGKYRIIPIEELKKTYPYAFSYLKSIKSELDKRDNGKVNKNGWHAFGRHQALDTGFGKKIIFAPMNKKPNFILWEDGDYTIYSGYFIKYNGDHKKLLKQLNSSDMEEFIAISARDFRDGWKAYNKRVIENFIVDPDLL